MKHFVALVAASLMVLPATAQEAAMPSDADIAKILGDRIGRDQANVGIAVAIIENGETRFISHGTLEVDGTDPVTEETLFEAGSITKVFTNLLLAQAVNDGKIDLDAPITDYLPDGFAVPETGNRAITAFDLATHHAGLTGLPEEILSRGIDNPYSGFGADALAVWFADAELARPVGEQFEYSNLGTALLGLALETVEGSDFVTLLTTSVLEPLGMDASSLEMTGQELPAMATGHNTAREATPNWDFEVFAPAGALIISSTDLIKFVAAASGQTQTSLAPAFETMLARTMPVEQGTSIGLGWFITTTGQSEIVWHNGMTGGYTSFAGFDRASGNGVVVLTNMAAQRGVNDIGMHLLNPAIPLNEQPQLRTAVEIDPALFDDYVGDYVLAPGVVLSVTEQDGQLFAQLTGQGAYEIFPEGDTQFFYKIVDAQITFDVTEGDVKSLVLHQNGQNLPGLKVVE
ncbi:serine hydrolase [Devosia chinhatensis]|uniref:serine hydrolase n=1 Tax=Devosia chinhatensis TaxID=429727 RepID=UPI0006977FA4|nr:serine hydrolase [Devosia chinhatensis]